MNRVWFALASVFVVACGGSPPTGPANSSSPPQITCPADQSVSGVEGSSQTVTFDAPKVTDGMPPVTTVCTPTSGGRFSVGATAVTCTATDALSRQAACSFTITLTGLSLTIKKFVSFGDSLTEGETGRPSATRTIIDVPNAYPTRLQELFDQSYPDQGITVTNRGQSGSTVERDVELIRQFVRADGAEAVLLLSGFNNLDDPCHVGNGGTRACASAIEEVAVGILDGIRKARESSPTVKYVFVSTLTPPGLSGSLRIDPSAITRANTRISQTVAAQGAVLVDSYSVFLGHEGDYVNVDGLHLRPAGYMALAETFFSAIQKTVPQSASLE